MKKGFILAGIIVVVGFVLWAASIALDAPFVARAAEATEFAILESITHTCNYDGSTYTNTEHLGVMVFLDIDTHAGGGDYITLVIQAQDPVSNQWVDIAKTAGIESAGLYVLELHPGCVTATLYGNRVAVNGALPYHWRVRVIHTSAGPEFVYSLGACYLAH